MNKALFFFFSFHFVSFSLFAQKPYSRKGEFFGYWGYNRATYANSDIHFYGKGYDFTLYDVVAKDRPNSFRLDTYLNPLKLSVPQYDWRIGYFFSDHWAISVGWDHMKYIMVNDQASTISGHISATVSDPAITVNPSYVGDYTHTPITINSKDFLTFEHTDGFNYANVELDRYDRIWKAKNNVQGLDWLVGVGTGVNIPRSDVRLFTVGKNNAFNLAGLAASIKAGLRFDISRLLFLQFDAKAGYTHMFDIHTTGRSSDHAQQNIWFREYYGVIGLKFGKPRVKNK
ncbi:MAG: hypothetical protein QM669_10215 [Siphonobacter sp.]